MGHYMKIREIIEPRSTSILPNENSLGHPISNSDEVLRNFWNWFGSSKAVDDQGRPLVVYHGTDKKFSKVNFKKGAQGIFWFTTDKSAIESGSVGAAANGIIMELYVRITNPASWKEYDQLMLGEFKARGLDGALLPESDGTLVGFIIDKPTQVKTVKNKGYGDDPRITHEDIEPQMSQPNTMVFWHGGNLTNELVLIPQKTGRFEYGAGLYATTHYDTARKYSKGSRKLYQITLSKGVDANNATISYDSAIGFVNQYVVKTKRAEIIQRLDRFNKDGIIPAYIFNNIILNEKAITATNTAKLSQFFVGQGIDYLLVPNAFGWGEMMVVVFNLSKVVDVRVIKPTDKIVDYDLPVTF